MNSGDISGGTSDDAIVLSDLSLSIFDSSVSTIGFLAGITIIGIDENNIIIVTIISILIGAISISVGTYLSNDALVSDGNLNQNESSKYKAAFISFGSSFLTGLVLIIPYYLIPDKNAAMYKSVMIAIILLFLLGFYDATVINGHPDTKVKMNKWRNAFKYALLGLVSIGCGVAAGKFLQGYVK
jgi:VIT1/CCC1 family predicted Fe2+/Mn2+ transporter